MIQLTEAWRNNYPGAAVGILAVEKTSNPRTHPDLEERKVQLSDQLRERYAGCDRTSLRALPTLQVYHQYYKRFKKTYHLQLQLESIVLQGKDIPSSNALVEAMFMAELGSLLLTSGHDLAQVNLPIKIDAAVGVETYVRINRQLQTLKAGDMYIADQEGILSSIIYGPDFRTRIVDMTTSALFTVYAPPGITAAEVEQHLENTLELIRVFSPHVQVTSQGVHPA
jgi:DNA/RNA-binding domain of Phe-tRNA-synthetase-like protein